MKKLNLFLITGFIAICGLFVTTRCKKDSSSSSPTTPTYYFKCTNNGSVYSYKQSTFALGTYNKESQYILTGTDGGSVSPIISTTIYIPQTVFTGVKTYTMVDPNQPDESKWITSEYIYSNGPGSIMTTNDLISGTLTITAYVTGSYIQGTYSCTYAPVIINGGNVSVTGTFYAQAQ